MINQNLLLAGEDAYNLQRSLRFRSSASAYLSRTPASAGNRKTWTWSSWIKRGALGEQDIFDSSNGAGSVRSFLRFNTSNVLYFQFDASTASITTTPVYRDPSAWYHIMLAVDSTQATNTNRLKLYVNGIQVTAGTFNYPSLNADSHLNIASQPFNIGRYSNGGEQFDGYLTEVNFIDGQALTPSSFGETDVLTGVWKPKKYAGTYGTNGFYLPFSDNASTTTLGNDFSGNGNNWTTNNISLTAGITYDSMTDVPTLTSATTANYAVMNPLDQVAMTSVTNANLTTTTNGTVSSNIRSTFAVSSGKWYWEVTCISFSTAGTWMIGVCDSTTAIGSSTWSGANGWAYYAANGEKYNGGTSAAYGATYTSNDVIGVALDMDNGTLAFYKNGVSQGTAYTGLTGKTLSAMNGSGLYSVVSAFNFGQRPFAYTPPTGFVALNTFNLPNSTIVAGNKQMDATLYTGNGSTQSVVNAGGFQPDLVWIKPRAAAVSHSLYDSVRGAFIALASNTTDADANYSPYGVTSFNSNGFSLNDVANGGYRVNGSPGGAFSGASAAYIGWQWKANGAAVTNTAGSITSQVSANTTAGFSIVTYTGSGAAGTVGHGLGVSPAMIITKNRTTGGNSWVTWHKGMANAYSSTTAYAYLDQTAAAATTTNFYDGTAMTSSTFRWQTGNININSTSNNYVSYCWSEVAGYSKFGSYTGNGSADGTFVFCGFRPKFLMWKRSDSTGDWIIFDTARDTFNYAEKQLVANSSAAEAVTGGGFVRIDMLSNGFKIRSTDSYVNANGGTYIFMAVAENPFKNSVAR